MRTLTLTLLCFILSFSSCRYDVLEEIKPEEENCDSSNVTYAKDIAPLFTSNCGTDNACHKASGSDSEISLANYDDVFAVASIGQLLSSVTHDGNAEPMPQDAEKLSACKINLIKAWINQGYKQN